MATAAPRAVGAPLDGNDAELGQRLAAALSKPREVLPPPATALPPAPPTRRLRPASEAQAAEGFRLCACGADAGSEHSRGEEEEEEAVGDENFVAMHAPCAPCATCSAQRSSESAALLRRSGEYREANRSHIADDSGRSVLTIGSLASQVGSSWHSSPAASVPACSPAAIEVRHTRRSSLLRAVSGLRAAFVQGWGGLGPDGPCAPSPMERPDELDLSAGSLSSTATAAGSMDLSAGSWSSPDVSAATAACIPMR